VLAASKLKEYYVSLIEKCKTENIPKECFIKDYLNSLYTEYHVCTLGRDVVPEKLRNDLNHF
jgi:hypothetical protein